MPRVQGNVTDGGLSSAGRESETGIHEVPDVRITETCVRDLDRAGPHARDVGLRIALELAVGIAERAQGLVVSGTDASNVAFAQQIVDICRPGGCAATAPS